MLGRAAASLGKSYRVKRHHTSLTGFFEWSRGDSETPVRAPDGQNGGRGRLFWVSAGPKEKAVAHGQSR